MSSGNNNHGAPHDGAPSQAGGDQHGKQARKSARKKDPSKLRALQEQRAAKAERKLAEWIKKAGIAVRKINEYTRRVAYYRKALEARRRKPPSNAAGRKFILD